MRVFLIFLMTAPLLIHSFGAIKAQSTTGEALPPELQKVVDFIVKKNACEFVRATICNPTIRDAKCHNNPLLKKELENGWQNSLYCITDLTDHEGTINEVRGCAISSYSASAAEYSRVSDGGVGWVLTKGKLCANGGFEALLNTILSETPGLGIVTRVVDILMMNGFGKDYVTKIVYSRSPEYRRIVEKIVAETAAKNEKKKKIKK